MGTERNTDMTVDEVEEYLKQYFGVSNAVNADGVPYEVVEIPLTETFYEELEDYGCYLNY